MLQFKTLDEWMEVLGYRWAKRQDPSGIFSMQEAMRLLQEWERKGIVYSTKEKRNSTVGKQYRVKKVEGYNPQDEFVYFAIGSSLFDECNDNDD